TESTAPQEEKREESACATETPAHHPPFPPSDVASLNIEEAEAPAWLQQGIEQAKSEGQTPGSPPPAPLQEGSPQASDETIAIIRAENLPKDDQKKNA
ncbi:MAG: hypothetical protein PHO92_04515, partial [Candidatus Peribacteraceae bacterium]|nr:hypothetical protein [Candidatus Peribacteraceae bacterium]